VDTLNRLRIVFDPAKDASNTVKHGISLAQAARIEWDDAVTWLDTRHDYGEARMCAIAYVDRADVRRVISLRKANLKEVQRYADA
jgi:uncharacterized DUF497 family protein